MKIVSYYMTRLFAAPSIEAIQRVSLRNSLYHEEIAQQQLTQARFDLMVADARCIVAAEQRERLQAAVAELPPVVKLTWRERLLGRWEQVRIEHPGGYHTRPRNRVEKTEPQQELPQREPESVHV